MRDRYYQLQSPSDAPADAALVRIYRGNWHAVARLDDDDEAMEADPDLILFRTALMRLRRELVGIFVHLEDETLWQAHWGDLVPYRGTRKSQRPAPLETPAFK